jgi:hypothetical protein
VKGSSLCQHQLPVEELGIANQSTSEDKRYSQHSLHTTLGPPRNKYLSMALNYAHWHVSFVRISQSKAITYLKSTMSSNPR